MLEGVMKFTWIHMIAIGVLALIFGAATTAGFMYNTQGKLVREGFVRVGGSYREGFLDAPTCNRCGQPKPRCECKPKCDECGKPASACGCQQAAKCPPVAPCPRVMEPDLSKYILKSQVPHRNKATMPDMSNYMLKTECPPCPRPRCPIVKCPPPTKCPTPAPCPRPVCPQTVVKCKSEEANNNVVRPFLAPLNMGASFSSA
jgi:hypothetical protein